MIIDNRFVHGGIVENTEALDSDQMYILSLPSFRWFRANYTSTHLRALHTCHATDSNQMIIIGGYNPNAKPEKKDPWSQGIGVFDMTTLEFKDSYEAKAGPYKTPDVIKRYYSTE